MSRDMQSRLVVATILTVVSIGGRAGAATIHVPAHQPTIQAGIDASSSGDTVLVAPGTYTGYGNQNIELGGRAITVLGEAGPESTILNCSNTSRGFYIHEGESSSTRIEGFTIRYGYSADAGGGIRVEDASPTLRRLVVERCESDSWAGGLYLAQSSAVVESLVVRYNQADGHGGGVSIFQSTPSFDWIVLSDNECIGDETYGGGLHVKESTVAASHLTVVDNSAEYGSGVMADFSAAVDLDNCIVTRNLGGVGIYWRYQSAPLGLTCSNVFANPAGNFHDNMDDPIGSDGNIAIDPWFCGSNDFTLDTQSPCLPANNDCTVLMGALGQGCETTHFYISGTLSTPTGNPVPGIELLTSSGTTVVSGADGGYVLDVLQAWSGTVMPTHPAYEFTPAERSYSYIYGNYVNQDYIADHESVIHVPGEQASIQAAIDASVAGDSILVAPGVYTGTGFRNVELPGHQLVIRGLGGPEETVLDCGGSYRAFWVHQGEDAGTVIEGFTIRNGGIHGNGGGICIEGSAPTLRSLRFESCRSGRGRGGALYLFQATGVLLEDIDVDGGFAFYEGGGIAVDQSSGTLLRVRISRCRSMDPGGGLWSRDSDLILDSCAIIANNCEEQGAGLALAGGATNLQNSLVAYNGPGSGGIHALQPETTFIAACSNVYANHGGNYSGDLVDPTGSDGNISVDPYFCDLALGDWSLHADSPCLPGNNGCGVAMGGLEQGCDYPIPRIAGHIRSESGEGVAGITITGLSATLITDEQGAYECRLPQGWGGSLTPFSQDYLFEPRSRSYHDLQADLTDEDYEAVHPTHVFVPNDFPTIEAALTYAVSGDTISVQPGEYILESWEPLDFLGRDILLRSLGGPAETILRWGETAFLFSSGEGPDAVLDGFTIRDCISAIRCENGSSPTLRNLVIEENNGYRNSGAGMVCLDASNPNIIGTTFRNNYADTAGALYCEASSPILTEVLFEANNSAIGGAVRLYGSSAVFTKVAFIRNGVSPFEDSQHGGIDVGKGGAVYCEGGAPSFLLCSFIGNEARAAWIYEGSTYGGAVYAASSAAPSFTNCTFADNGVYSNTGDAQGGTLYCEGEAAPDLRNCIIGFSTSGGGIHCETPDCDIALTCCDVFGNVGGDYVGIADMTGVNGNLSDDPQFCGIPGSGNIYLQADSPCLHENNECGVQIGSHSQGCGFTPVFLTEFTALPAAGAIDLLWLLGSEQPSADFELHAEQAGVSWSVPWHEVAAGSYAARDESPKLAVGGQVIYRLSGKLPGESWQFLRSITVDLPPARETQLLGPYPNPFNPATELTFHLAEPGAVSLAIYDLTGRRMAVLAAGELYEAGRHTVTWTGHDDAGGRLASGVYFARFSAGGYSAESKLVLLK